MKHVIAKELRLVLLGVAAIVAVTLGAGLLKRALTHAPGTTTGAAPATSTASDSVPAGAPNRGEIERGIAGAPDSVPAGAPNRGEIERGIAGAPDYARFFGKLEAAFPADYASIMNGVAATTRPGQVNVDLVMADAVTALRRVHGTLATKASSAALEQIFTLQLREMQLLAARDPQLCVAFLYGASGSGFLPFAADHRALVADSAIAGLDAMTSGLADPNLRAKPTEADFQALEAALVAKGLTRPQIDALLDGKSADPPIADADMCQAGQTYLGTLAAMPADARGRLYALAVDLMAKS